MKQIKIWIEAIRLRTLPVSVSGVLIAVGLAKFNGQFRLLPSLICVVCWRKLCRTWQTSISTSKPAPIKKDVWGLDVA